MSHTERQCPIPEALVPRCVAAQLAGWTVTLTELNLPHHTYYAVVKSREAMGWSAFGRTASSTLTRALERAGF